MAGDTAPNTLSLPANEDADSVENSAVADGPSVARTVLPAGTDVVIQIDAAVSSRTATRGDMFPISLASPVIVAGVEILPAGLTGEGQVVHAADVGFGGRAGELIVAARYLMWGDQRIALRSMRISRAGLNNTAEAIAAGNVIPFAGLFVTGTSVDLPAGQIAAARLSADVSIPPELADRAERAIAHVPLEQRENENESGQGGTE